MSTTTAVVAITKTVREEFTAAPLNCVIGQPNLGSICLTTFDVAELHVAITENVVSLKVLTAMVTKLNKGLHTHKNCNKEVYHKDENCYELEANKANRYEGWKSCFK